jgi:3-hydroxyacyl-CoA dehydrogenase
MGAGIAAHLANLGFQVTLLDTTQQTVAEGLDRARQANPPHFYLPERANEIRIGNIVEHLSWAAESDWVIEAVAEKAEVKRRIYMSLDPILAPSTFVTTNTSGLPIAALAEGLSPTFRRRFFGTHFFNPPRYLKLLEIVPTPETDPQFLTSLVKFLEGCVEKRVIRAKDTPGFIANRYGMWCMFHAMHVADQLHLSVEQVDEITGPFIGRPTSASYRLNDLVGLDVMLDIASSLCTRCGQDPHMATFETPAAMAALLSRGWLGQKSGHGFYRKESNELLVLDLQTFAYRPRQEVSLPSIQANAKLPLGERIDKVLTSRDEAGEFLRLYLIPALRYADYLRTEISHSVSDFDHVMEWGFGWQMGPFKMIDAIGHHTIGVPSEPYYRGAEERAHSGGYIQTPVQPQYQSLQDFSVVAKEDTYLLRDLGDGVTAVSLNTKLGVITPHLVDQLIALLDSKHLDRIVLTSESRSFSVGYDLNFFMEAIQEDRTRDIEKALVKLGRLGELLEEHHSVAALSGYALGAGMELALSCRHIVADAESKPGLPEARVGLLPAGRGVALTRLINQIAPKRLAELAVVLASGTTAQNGEHARHLGLLRPTDVISYHPDRHISSAKELALHSKGLTRPAWAHEEGPVVGMIDRELAQAKQRGDFSDHDLYIGNHIKQILAKSSSFEDAIQRERVCFLDLCGKTLTQTRIKHMLETGKPLRN